MLPHPARRRLRRAGSLLAVLAGLSVTLASSSCDKVPLLAPTGSVITLFATANTVPSNGSMEVVATVIEQGTASTTTPPANGGTTTTPGTTATSTPGAGTPVHNGTVVTFTTTIGRIEPSEARTDNGQVRVRFHADGQSGTAVITAFSGGASGKLENLKVGSAGAERILLSANPQALACSGGDSQISARVEDVSGVGLPAVPVVFTTTKGGLDPSSTNTDSSGTARTTLKTTQEATVTANAAGKTATATVTLSPRTGITITPPTGTLSVGVPITFTVNVAATANIRNVTVNFGDGVQDLGPISGSTAIPHTYRQEGTYIITATAVDAAGCSEAVSTAVSVLPGQPPSVVVRVSDPTPAVGQKVTFTATVSGNTSTIVGYDWDFGSNGSPQTAPNVGSEQEASFNAVGTFTVTVTVRQGAAGAPSGRGLTSVTVSAALTAGSKK